MLLALALAATLAPPADLPTPAPLVCAEGTVPGWLGEDGLPTSCVGDLPCPPVPFGEPCPAAAAVPEAPPAVAAVPEAPPAAEPVAEVAPAPIVSKNVLHAAHTDGFDHQAAPAVPMLAETGSKADVGLLAALVLLLLGTVGAVLAFVTGGSAAVDRSIQRNLARAKKAGHDANAPECSYYRGDFAGVDLSACCPECPPRPIAHRAGSSWFA